MYIILLINVKMPTNVGIKSSAGYIHLNVLKQGKILLSALLFLGAVEISCSVKLNMKKNIISGQQRLNQAYIDFIIFRSQIYIHNIKYKCIEADKCSDQKCSCTCISAIFLWTRPIFP